MACQITFLAAVLASASPSFLHTLEHPQKSTVHLVLQLLNTDNRVLVHSLSWALCSLRKQTFFHLMDTKTKNLDRNGTTYELMKVNFTYSCG